MTAKLMDESAKIYKYVPSVFGNVRSVATGIVIATHRKLPRYAKSTISPPAGIYRKDRKMGTRALITINQKPFIATHWDGYPSALGADLLGKTTEVEIRAIAEKHDIDFACARVRQQVNKKRYAEIAKKTKGAKKEYTAKEIEALDKQGKHLQFNLMGNGDYPIGSIKNYGDWAEYQYDLQDGKWYYRPLSGGYPQSLVSASKLKRLTKEAIKAD